MGGQGRSAGVVARLGELTTGDQTRALSGLVGRWRLVAWEITHGPDETMRPLGDDAHGLLIYTADGSMAAQITAADRKPLGSADPLGGSEPERAAAYSTCLAYCGRYEVRGETVVHTVEVSLFPDWAGAQQVRVFELAGDHLTLRTPPIDVGDATVTAELRWVRDATP
jgi:hypothetical protein